MILDFTLSANRNRIRISAPQVDLTLDVRNLVGYHVATKQIVSIGDTPEEIKANAEKVWMAGLGALATAEEEGGKLFRGLVKKGESFEKKGLAQLDKLKSNLKEVQARGGELYVFADADSEIAASEGVQVLRLPEHYGELSPILHVVPLQLLSYHVALVKGTDVDKPRNLAKSVTVE